MAGAGVLSLLIPMLAWSLTPVFYGGQASLPYAGPELRAEGRQRGLSEDVTALAGYLLDNQGEATFLAATIDARTASPLILATGEPVMALGGFSGSDPILTEFELAQMVSNGEVRFFLLTQQQNRQEMLVAWVAERCDAIPQTLVAEAAGGRPGSVMLFDCAGWVQRYAEG